MVGDGKNCATICCKYQTNPPNTFSLDEVCATFYSFSPNLPLSFPNCARRSERTRGGPPDGVWNQSCRELFQSSIVVMYCYFWGKNSPLISRSVIYWQSWSPSLDDDFCLTATKVGSVEVDFVFGRRVSVSVPPFGTRRRCRTSISWKRKCGTVVSWCWYHCQVIWVKCHVQELHHIHDSSSLWWTITVEL